MDVSPTQHVVDAYERKTDPFFSKPHGLKPIGEHPESARVLRVYTDGASKVDSKSPGRSAYSGWSFVVKDYSAGGGKPRTVQHDSGYLLNGVSTLAELEAIHRAVSFIDRPSHVSLVTDSAQSIEYLSLGDEGLSLQIDQIQAKEQLRGGDVWSLRCLNKARTILSAMEKPEIKSAEISWVRSHTLDRLPTSEMPEPDQAETGEDRLLVEDLIGNRQADQHADEGAKKGIKKALLILHDQIERGHPNAGKTIAQMQKNMASYFVTETVIDYLSEKPEGFLTQQCLSAILTDQQQSFVGQKRQARMDRDSKREDAPPFSDPNSSNFLDQGRLLSENGESQTVHRSNRFSQKHSEIRSQIDRRTQQSPSVGR